MKTIITNHAPDTDSIDIEVGDIHAGGVEIRIWREEGGDVRIEVAGRGGIVWADNQKDDLGMFVPMMLGEGK